jgi:predicted RNase H-like HicB family nuclease
MKKYAAIFERICTGWSACAPDLPGFGVVGPTYEATEELIRAGISFPLVDGEAVAEPATRVAQIPICA